MQHVMHNMEFHSTSSHLLDAAKKAKSTSPVICSLAVAARRITPSQSATEGDEAEPRAAGYLKPAIVT